MYRVLVIDDDKLARKGIISIVNWEQCHMRVVGDVANGALALDFLSKNEVDLAIVDLSMPVLSGLDFIKESRALYPNLQYVALSFHEEFEYVQSALRYGALDYISKLRLEQEDCNNLFMRVSSVLDSISAANPPEEEKLSDNVYEDIKQKCLSLFWIYDSDYMEQLLTELQQKQLSIRQLDHILVNISVAIQQAFQMEIPIEPFTELADGIALLHQIRDKVLFSVYDGTPISTPEACILRAVQYIRAHLADTDLKVESIAENIGMSRGYFSNMFKKYTDQTVNSFIRKMRISLAKRLLKYEDLSACELAERVGYKDEKYFSRLFVEQVGVNCAEFRKQFSSSSPAGKKTLR